MSPIRLKKKQKHPKKMEFTSTSPLTGRKEPYEEGARGQKVQTIYLPVAVRTAMPVYVPPCEPRSVPFSYKRTGSKVEAWSHCAGALEGPHGAGSVIPAGIGSLFGSAADLYLRHGVEIMTRGL